MIPTKHPLASVLLVIAGFAAIILLGATYSDILDTRWKTNQVSVQVLDTLLPQESPNPVVLENVKDEPCLVYSTAISLLHTAEFQSLSPEQQLHLLSQIVDCQPPERRPMLTVWSTAAEWDLGRYREVCASFVALNAPDRLLELAKQSQDRGNWLAVEEALACVQRFPPDGAWVSPFVVARLYYHLGQHNEELDQVEKALDAYDAAARWYPEVWAVPTIKKAALLWRQGTQQEAIQWLVDAVSRSTDVTATFDLWKELGSYWQLQGELADAYCAYHNADQVMSQVPLQNLTASVRELLQAQLDSLTPVPMEDCFVRYPPLR